MPGYLRNEKVDILLSLRPCQGRYRAAAEYYRHNYSKRLYYLKHVRVRSIEQREGKRERQTDREIDHQYVEIAVALQYRTMMTREFFSFWQSLIWISIFFCTTFRNLLGFQNRQLVEFCVFTDSISIKSR